MDYAKAHKCAQELLAIENRMIRITEKFLPKTRSVLLTNKFYSKHEQDQDIVKILSTDPEWERKYEDYKTLVKNSLTQGSKEKYNEPMTENNTYGWEKPVQNFDKQDRARFFHPIVKSEFVYIDPRIYKI